jgi:outer membrane lipoprotein-sorting protein
MIPVPYLRLIPLISLVILISCKSTGNQYLSKNFASRGGIEALNKISSKKLTGKFILQQQDEVQFTIYLKYPEQIRVESIDRLKTYITAYDGETCWWINSLMNIHVPTEMPEPNASRLKEMQMLYWGYLQSAQRHHYDFEYAGRKHVEKADYYILQLIKNGHKEHLFLDSEQYFERRLVGKLPERDVQAETLFGDYKKVNGIYFPHRYEFIIGGKTEVVTIVDRVELNIPMDDSLFSMMANAVGPN